MRGAAIPLSELMGASRPAQPLEDMMFERPADARPPSNVLNGKLTLLDTSAIRYKVLRDDEGERERESVTFLSWGTGERDH